MSLFVDVVGFLGRFTVRLVDKMIVEMKMRIVVVY